MSSSRSPRNAAAARALALALLARAAAADSALTVNAAWFMDASVASFTPKAQDWFDPVASPIDLALRDLRRDWFKVLGVNPSVITSLPTGRWDGDAVVVFALAQPGAAPAESFTVVAAAAGGACSAPTLTVTGADVRGLIYGVYHVSADFLAVDPWWWWGDASPAFEAAGVAVAEGYSYASGAPAFDSRGAFNNDEDLSGYFASSPLGDAVFHTFWADRFCETLLRMRVNTFIPSTFAYIDESHYRVAAKRGLRLGNHHVMPLGNNVAAWPHGVPYAYRLNPEPFLAAWRALAAYQQHEQGREMVYSLGYRGVNDEPFWNEDTGCATSACRGATITQAIANQSAIVQLETPFAVKPRMVAYMWMELLQLLEDGTLVLPPDVACTWTDFPGAFLFEGGFANVTAGHGYYAHISMMNGEAGQLVEFIPPARIFANVWQFYSRNATKYGMINLSDLRFVPLTAEAVYRYMYDPESFNASAACRRASIAGGAPPAGRDAAGRRGHVGAWPVARPGLHGCSDADFGRVTPAQAQDAFILEFATRHFGAAAGAQAADLYGRYFNISYMATAVPGTATKADHYLGSRLRSLVSAFAAGGSALRSAADECAGVAAANLAFVTQLYEGGVVPLAAALPAHSPASRFFNGHLLAQSGIHFFHLEAFQAAAAAAYAHLGGDNAAAAANVTIALAAMDGLLAVLREAEGHGAWHGSYAADGWTWCWGSRQALASLLASLTGRVLPSLPDNPYPDYEIMTYELTTPNDPTDSPSFPFATFNASIAFDAVPRFACAADIPGAAARPSGGDADAAAAACTTTWVGATLTSASDVGLFVANYTGPGARLAPRTIHFTLDGSAPSAASPAYSAPFSLAANATVRSRSFDDASGAPLGPESAATVTLAA